MEDEEAGVRRWLVDITRWRPSAPQFDAAAALLPSHERPAITNTR
jgi:4'-phosphopantetheinyl transferase